jgi:3'-phosphoadenosine 5'-phosphosulfate sulfotransferase
MWMESWVSILITKSPNTRANVEPNVYKNMKNTGSLQWQYSCSLDWAKESYNLTPQQIVVLPYIGS